MRKFWEVVMEWKTTAALVFSGSVILYMVVMFFLGQKDIPIPAVISLLIISAAGSFFQLLAFTEYFIKKMRYSLRVFVFAIPFLALLAINAWFFRWVPVDTTHWLSFIIIFLVVFAGMTIGFEIYYHAMGKKYDGLLGQYRKQRESGKD